MGRNHHNLRKSVFSSIALFAAFALTQSVQAATAEDLEPCINGGVSESGLYVSQAQEDRAKQFEVVERTRKVDEQDLEPCINGGVSESGMYISQAVEDEITREQFARVN